ncbi:MAG: hypothetical protein J4G18_11535 [Anaerolineae bacterium]|nr:hypothetical protein [Anaerolineae bacterium]
MQASIADILNKRGRFAGQVVNIDGILLITDYDRESARFEQVWLVKKPSPRDSAIRARPIRSDSTLWHGLSRLNPRHMAGFLTYRVHDAVRACVRVLEPPRSESDPAIDILTAAIYRKEFTLYVGEKGVRLDQALPTGTSIAAVPDIQANIARFLGRRCFVYGTLVVRSAPAAQFLLPGRIPYTRDFRSSLERSSDDEVNDEWLADIEYPQSDSEPPDFDALPESIHIDQDYAIKEQLSVLPGINQTIVKPAIVVGRLGARDHDEHFATLSEIEDVYLQNVCFGEPGKSLESVIKLKNFEVVPREI